ncbi:MAG: translocation and assembly module protein TamB, partial [Alphaproteobacteria bacterium HGW-Alphaproteobacteria-2]
MMRRYLSLLACLALFAPPLAAQTEDEDRGFLVRTLEGALSGAGREVRIEGFRGALSSTATLETLTIADDAGVWITLSGVALDWRRAALLSGRVEVTALTADEIVLERLPAPAPGLPAPEAGSFRLPELPVSVELGEIRADRVALGEAVLGEAVVLQVAGGAALVGGRVQAQLSVLRTDDGPAGRLALDLDYDEAAARAALDVSLEEAPGGIAARVLGLPGAPDVALSLVGAGPFDDFAARLRLMTGGAERLAGSFILKGADAGARRFSADLSGDVTALVAPDLRGFFGPEVALRAEGLRAADGALELEDFTLRAAALSLSGAARLGADGFPERLAVEGRLAAPGGGPVRLPLGGAPALVQSAELHLAHDATEGPGWTGRFAATGFRRGGAAAERLQLDVAGEMARGTPGGVPLRRVTARLDLGLSGLDLADPALAGALGQDVRGGADIAWQEDAPLRLSQVRLAGRDYALALDGTLSDLTGGLRAEGRAEARIDRLESLAGLAGRPLAGAVQLDLSGEAVLLTGAFDIEAQGSTNGLAVGEPVADALIGGAGRLALAARRDAAGLLLRSFMLETPGVAAGGEGRLATGDADIRFQATIRDVARIEPRLAGPATLAGTLVQTGPEVQLDLTAAGPGGASASARATLAEPQGARDIAGQVQATLPDLSRFAELVGLPLSGRASLTAEGTGRLSTGAFAATAEARTEALALGQALLDPLLGGAGRLSLAVEGADNGAVRLSDLRLETPGMLAEAAGTLRRSASIVEIDVRIRDVALLTPELSGPLALSGRVAEADGERLTLALDLAGPGDSTGRVSGSVPASGEGPLDLALVGRLPLALADAALGPQGPRLRGPLDIDLALRGTPGFGALAGRVSVTGARVLLPAEGIVLEDATASANIAGGTAELEARARVQEGGSIAATGRVALDAGAGFPGQLEVALSEMGLRQRGLYRTALDGRVTLDGPLAGGALIAGRVELGRTELRIPSSALGAGGGIPEITHQSEPAEVRATRRRAGLVAEARAGTGPRRAWPLDMLIVAPRRIFLRGRGVDAELGGEIRLGGTTAAPLPSGRFELIRGRLEILGKRLELTEGSATLAGDFNPEVRVVARSRSDDGTEAFITLAGSADNPEITFSSVPDLPQDEVLARLFFGRGIETVSPLQAAQLASAVATLAGGGNGGGLLGGLRRGVGLDDLDVTSSAEGVTTARVGKYVTERVYTDVEVGSDGRSTVSINLDVTGDLRARGRVNTE